MKKILLGLGTLSLAALPVMAVVSCGGTTETKTDLGITSKTVTQTVINKAITDFTATGAADPAKITALQTVFDGITAENFKNFTVKATPTAGTPEVAGTIVLTANSGFAFGKEATLTSKLLVDLKITSKTVTQTVIDTAITAYTTAATDAAKQLAALTPIFDGITTESLKNFDVKATATSGSVAGTIVLTAKPGFAFGEASTLSSAVTTATVK